MILGLRVGTGRQESVHQGQVPVQGRLHQRGPPAGVAYVGGPGFAQQGVEGRQVPALGGADERRWPFGVDGRVLGPAGREPQGQGADDQGVG